MSLFSTHYLITNADGNGYWTGEADPNHPRFWGGYDQAVRFHTKASAAAVLDGVLGALAKTQVRIVEDE